MTRGYYVEVGWGDYDVDQERQYHAIGPFRSRAVADRIRAQIQTRLDRESTSDSGIVVGAMVRPFQTKDRVLAGFLAWIENYRDDAEAEAQS